MKESFSLIFEYLWIFPLLISSLFLLILGIAFIAGHYSDRSGARTVPGKIVGVRTGASKLNNSSRAILYPVYEYLDFDSKPVRAECTSGSSSMKGKLPGTEQWILVKPAFPCRCSRKSNALLFLGYIFSISGGGLLWMVISKFGFSYHGGVISLLLLIVAGFKLKSIIKPKEEWEEPGDFQQRKYDEFLERRRALPLVDAVDKGN